ncbi:hypothetical protein FH972_025807 [Carpinus fangiana]|uniref:Uncharacterized protein n=1 Tax=Carpinus fangiana TaxID=176857 RepID=A0A5N6L231_9ROSI|nr:hypothetical protein FH972_025807 [Carpinus fangiana]
MGNMVASSREALREFFSLYPTFSYNPGAPSTDEFYRMCKTFGWKRDNPARESAYQSFQDALVSAFNYIYGSDANDLASWRGLCAALEISPVPTNVQDAKIAFESVHVNLVDLVDTGRTGIKVRKFASVNDLRVYTRNSGKIFPREHAYAGGMLKHLLREISGTYEGQNQASRRGSGYSRRRRSRGF